MTGTGRFKIADTPGSVVIYPSLAPVPVFPVPLLPSGQPRYRRDRLNREGLERGAAVAGPPDHEHRGVVEEPVQHAQQGRAAGEELVPLVRREVAGHQYRVGPVLLAPGVHDVEQQVGALLVELAPAYLVYDQAGGPYQLVHRVGGRARPHRLGELVGQLAGLHVVGLQAPLAARPAVGLGEVRLADALRPDEREVAPGVQVGRRRQPRERLAALAPHPAEVEVVERLRALLGYVAHVQVHLRGALPLLRREVGRRLGDGLDLGRAHAPVLREAGYLRRGHVGADGPRVGRDPLERALLGHR